MRYLKLENLVLIAGAILIALRLFFPLRPCDNPIAELCRVSVAPNAFQVIGIAILTATIFYIIRSGKDS